ncbi:UNVERIFIED_CONTAM: protein DETOXIFICATION 35 [Sesamum latifolium]|uniref:Protein DETOXIFICATION 35 n=1 Tax=Sesamum latifolium TaxID=2727402 RepID=A0AAW2S2Q1_9LAMI
MQHSGFQIRCALRFFRVARESHLTRCEAISRVYLHIRLNRFLWRDIPSILRENAAGGAHLSSLLGVTMLLNSIQPVISGVAIGGGWQALVAYINLGCYYILVLPLGYVLGYVAHFGVMGIWGGMIAGLALQTLLLFIILYKTNWNKEVEQTTERMRKWGGHDTAVSTHQLSMKNGTP